MKTEKEIVEHNEKIMKDIKELQKKINTLSMKKRKLRKKIIPPCEYCKYEGVYRCEACIRDYFVGFNVRDYPR